MNSRRIVVFVSILLAGLAVGIFFAPALFKTQIENKISQSLREECQTCVFSMSEIGWAWRGIALSGIEFQAGEKDGQSFSAKIPRLVIRPDLGKLLTGKVDIDVVKLIGPRFIFKDIEKIAPPSKDRPDSEEGMKAKLRRLVVTDGIFKYSRDVKGTHAELTIQKIQADAVIRDGVINALAKAQFGESGDFDLRMQMPAFKRPLEVDLDLSVRDQNLADLSAFFKPNAGVELKGILRKGHATTRLRGRTAQASVRAEYEKFDLKLHKMYDRDKWQAFFTTLGAKIAMRKENADAPPKEQRESLTTHREPGESLVSFILRGWKEAAIDLTM